MEGLEQGVLFLAPRGVLEKCTLPLELEGMHRRAPTPSGPTSGDSLVEASLGLFRVRACEGLEWESGELLVLLGFVFVLRPDLAV